MTLDENVVTIFQTRHLTIRPFSGVDVLRLSDFGRPEIARMMTSLLSPWPRADIQDWIAGALYTGRIGFRAGAYLGDELIGFVGIGGEPVMAAYAVHPDYQRRGFATEMMQGLAKWAFDQAGQDFIGADHFHDNPVSGRILRKCGFEEYGTDVGKSAARLEPEPVVLYRLTKQRFNALNKRATS